ncbi:TauD/TfdA family dioxygenase [Streptomyces angustmyceticus]|uniref:TauD/TfdA family dioxygenase n=1 Tax=Streptomyces angustmyceticus TaxID=285578 RepID=UPI0021AEC36B|nr:TauD/TfdA family dioxygenase [Streptomyces angustmyceticus]
MHKLVLTAEERASIDVLVDGIVAADETWDPMAAMDRAAEAAPALPRRLRAFLAQARAAESDVTVVSGLPIDPGLPPTPSGWDLAAKSGAGHREEVALLLCGTALGDPFGWESQQDGRIVHDVCPAPGMEASLTSASSAKTLSLHTEDVFHPCRADYVSLLCLRNPDAVGTTVTRVGSLDFPDSLRDTLRESRFRFYPDDSHTGTSHSANTTGDACDPSNGTMGPVLFGPEHSPYLRFDIDFMSGEDEEAAEAVTAAQEMLSKAAGRVALEPGDAVFIDNYQAVHGREPFAARYDGNDRWLKRLNISRDIRRLYAGSTNRSRIIPA